MSWNSLGGAVVKTLHFITEADAGSDSRSHMLQGLAKKIIKKNVSYHPAFLLKLPRDIHGYMYVCIHTYTTQQSEGQLLGF